MNWRQKPKNSTWGIDVAQLIVLYDACVLYPAPLRDLLMHLALTDLFQAKWSDRIHEGWIRNVLVNRPDLSREQLARTRTLMDTHVQDALVENDDVLIDTLNLPDPDDRHVLAAAIVAKADLILTFNLRDFPAQVLQPYGIQARHPDRFISDLLSSDPDNICAAVQRHRASLRYPPKTITEYLEIMERQGLSQTVAKLSKYREVI
jgi:predicted nucleic acid-binding protein